MAGCNNVFMPVLSKGRNYILSFRLDLLNLPCTIDVIMLRELLLKWDRKQVDFLKKIYAEYGLKETFINDVIEMYITSIELKHSTSWIIKHHLDNGKTLTEEQVDKVLTRFEALEYWECQLHVLQIIPKVCLTRNQSKAIEPTIQRLLKSERKLVKAAAYEAYFEVVKFFPLKRKEFLIFCEDAIVDESASVKVKIRRILNEK